MTRPAHVPESLMVDFYIYDSTSGQETEEPQP